MRDKFHRVTALMLAVLMALIVLGAAGCRNSEAMGEPESETEEFAKDDAILKR